MKKNSIGLRLTAYVIFFSSLIALCATAVQLYFDYRAEVGAIHSFLGSIEETHLRQLEESVWVVDDLQINLQLEGLIHREDIRSAAVSLQGQTVWKRMAATEGQRQIVRHYPLLHQGRKANHIIGTLTLVASLDGVYQRLMRRVFVILLSNCIKTFLVGGFILAVFRRHVTRHLEKMGDFVEQMKIVEPASPLVLDDRPRTAPDEIDQVAGMINTMQKRGHLAYEELRLQEERLRLFFDSSAEGIFSLDAEGNCTFMNKACLSYFFSPLESQIMGSKLQTILKNRCTEDIHSCGFYSLIAKTLETGKPMRSDEERLCHPDGTCFPISLRSYPIIDEEERSGVVVFFSDISKQQDLKREIDLLAKVIRQSPVVVAISDNRGVLEYVNPGFEKLVGYSAKEVLGRKPFFLWNDLVMPGQLLEMVRSLGNGKRWRGRFTNRSKGGSIFTMDTVVAPVYGRNGKITNLVAVATDSSREQELVNQLHHAQKMEAIGKLAASIAHEFGNPLLGVRFAIRDLKSRLSLADDDMNLLELAEKECDRMKSLIRDLRDFNRPTTGLRTPANLHEMLESIILFQRKFFSSRQVKLVKDFSERQLTIIAVEDQIRQVFMNLLLNAVEAIDGESGVVKVVTACEDNLALVEIHDNGCGIMTEDMAHIFEPFYTTKAAVEGTGLGLPVSYGIVKAHGGSITVRSSLEATVFTVRLPMSPLLQGEK